MGKMEGTIALVTRSGNGIGRGTAILFASEGAFVIVADKNPEDGDETVRRIEEAGGKAVFIQTDVSQISEIEALIAHVTEEYGHLDTVSYC